MTRPHTYTHFDPNTFPGILFSRSHLAHQIVSVSQIIGKKALGLPVFPFERRGDFYLAWKPYGWGRVRGLIGEMQTLLRRRGGFACRAGIRMSDQVNDSYRMLDETYVLYPQRKIREICDDFGIPILDLTETLYRQGGITLFRDHLHLNAKGNNIITDELENYLVEALGLKS